ncbi:MAG: DUF4176 domain-containing protein [Lachnospiraceae bacterium]|nr:DUF4176 domain-containing protein [Lachnospiraceae bacterium]
MRNYLPIGSVVLLKGAEKRIMICGRLQAEVESGKLFDYSGCLYPEGILSPKDMFLFNHADIETVYFIGFQDPEELAFKKYINEQIDKHIEEEKRKAAGEDISQEEGE